MSAEAKLISALLKNKDIGVLFSENADQLFTTHGDIWAGVKRYYQLYKTIPSPEVLQERFDDFEFESVTGDTQYYLDRLKEDFLAARLRSLFLEESRRLKDGSAQDVIRNALNGLNDLNKVVGGSKDVDITDLDSALKHYEAVKNRSDAMGGSPGIPTGFASIDSAYSTGMAPGHLIVCIGWPSRGKTWMSTLLAIKAWEQGFRPMIVSLEMSPETMRDRIYTMIGSGAFKNSDLVRGAVAQDSFKSWASRSFEDKNSFIVVSAEGMDRMTPSIVAGKVEQHKPDLLIVDYHQLFEDNKGSKSDVERNMNISKEFKRMAVKYAMPVIDITAATEKTPSDRDTSPTLGHVAWSKSIEYDADMAFSVHKSNESIEGRSIVEVVSRKNRHGEDFAFYLDWDFNRGIIKEMHGDGD